MAVRTDEPYDDDDDLDDLPAETVVDEVPEEQLTPRVDVKLGRRFCVRCRQNRPLDDFDIMENPGRTTCSSCWKKQAKS